jgi:hypothetical protein
LLCVLSVVWLALGEYCCKTIENKKEVAIMVKRNLRMLAFASYFIAACVSGAIVIPPPGLNPGDQYRLVFVTSGTRDATSTNIADYNAFVNAQAAGVVSAGFPTSGWTAIASTESVDARTNTGTASGGGVPIYRVDGVRVADDYTDLWNGGNLLADLSVTQQGNFLPGPPCSSGPFSLCLVWTGTSQIGDASVPLGGNTGSPLGSGTGEMFQEFVPPPDPQFGTWISVYFDSRSRLYPLYAMSDVLTVGSAPPPATYTVGGNISGLTGSVTLRNNGADNLIGSANGAFTFATALATGSAYAVSVFAQPTGQTCTVANGSGTIASANVTGVTVNCVDDAVTPPGAPPGAPSGANSIPTLPAYGLALTVLGLLLVAGRRLRASAKRR